MDAADRRGVKPVDPEFVDTLGDFDALGLSSRPEFDRFLVLLLAAGGVHMLKFLVEEYDEEDETSQLLVPGIGNPLSRLSTIFQDKN